MAENNGVEYRDPSPLTDANVQMIKDLIADEKYIDAASWVSKWLKEKLYGKPTRGALSIWAEQIGLSVGTMKTLVNAVDELSKETDARLDRSIGALTKDSEVADARGGHTVLSKREDAQDEATAKVQAEHNELSRNVMQVNTEDLINKMSILAVQPRPEGSANFAQTMQLDSQTGLLYIAEQTDDAGSQYINEYDPKTHELVRSRYLGINDVTWLEGNSLFHDMGTQKVCFIVPQDRKGTWAIYNFDEDSWGEKFHADGAPKYCIDNRERYFVTMQTDYVGRNSEIPIGFNLYDLESVKAGSPNLVQYIPVNGNLVSGNNKIQGFTMIGQNIIIGRGKRSTSDWFRTTTINTNGSVIGDWHWDEQQIIDLIQPEVDEGHQLTDVESEGMSINYLNGEYVPVLILLANGKDSKGTRTVDYVMLTTNDPDGTEIGATAGIAVAQLTRNNTSGIYPGVPIVLTKDDRSILEVLETIKESGQYTFSVDAENPGLYLMMKSGTGTAIARVLNDSLKISVRFLDYDNILWTTYYDSDGLTGTMSKRPHWHSWSSASLKPIIIRDAFELHNAPSGVYWSYSAKDGPAELKDSERIYTIKCFDNILKPDKARTIEVLGLQSNTKYTQTYTNKIWSEWRKL